MSRLWLLIFLQFTYAKFDKDIPSICLGLSSIALNSGMCSEIYQAAAFGLSEINLAETSNPMQLVQLKFGQYSKDELHNTSTIYKLIIQVAPFNCELDRSTDINDIKSQQNCSLALESSKDFKITIRRNFDGSFEAIQLKSFSISEKESDNQIPNLLPIPGIPTQGSAIASTHFTPAFLVSLLVGVAILTSIATIILRQQPAGYSSIDNRIAHQELHKRSAVIYSGRKELQKSNPIPENEEITLTHSHAHHERFAV